MSDPEAQEQTQTTVEAPVQPVEQAAEQAQEMHKESKKRFSIPKVNLSGIVSFVRKNVISIAMNLAILGVVCFLFFLQVDRVKKGGSSVVNIEEEKVVENLMKKLEQNEEVSQRIKQKKTWENKQAKREEETPDSKDESHDVKVDTSKFVIEANRLYEQGDYKSAANLYEKGLDKSMPFLNEDFVMFRLGDCYFMSEKYEEAIKVFQSLNNDYINSAYHFKSRMKVGECYAGLGEYEKARKTLYTVVAQEGKCSSADDKAIVVDAYFKIADYYMQEAQRLRTATAVGTGSAARSVVLK